MFDLKFGVFIGLWILILSINTVKAQEGYIKHYDIDHPGAVFTNLLMEGDTLIVSGITIQDTFPFIQVIFLAKLDTNGMVYESQVYKDSLDSSYSFDTPPIGMVATSDHSGYLLLGHAFNRANGLVMKISHTGHRVWVKEYPDPNSSQDYYRKITEVENGFFIFGHKFNKGTQDLFIKKIDTNGEEIWEKKYGEGNGRQDYIQSVLQIDDNEIVIGASSGSNQNVPWQQYKTTVRIFAIDSLGMEKWSWESEQWLEETRVTGLHRMDNGGWIYVTTRLEFESDGFFKRQPRLIIRDSDFNLVKSIDLDDMDGQDNLLYNMISLLDGGYLGVGTNYELVENPGVADEHFYAWMVRLDEKGDTLWQRRYLTFPDTVPNGTIQYLHSAVELPSGSIICAGYYDGFTYPKDWGILIKVDANGCVDTLGCGPISDLFQVDKPDTGVLVYPNPSDGDVTFSWPGSFSSNGISIRLFDSNGKIIREIPVLLNATSVQWHTDGLSPGMYFYQMMSKEGLLLDGKVILQDP